MFSVLAILEFDLPPLPNGYSIGEIWRSYEVFGEKHALVNEMFHVTIYKKTLLKIDLEQVFGIVSKYISMAFMYSITGNLRLIGKLMNFVQEQDWESIEDMLKKTKLTLREIKLKNNPVRSSIRRSILQKQMNNISKKQEKSLEEIDIPLFEEEELFDKQEAPKQKDFENKVSEKKEIPEKKEVSDKKDDVSNDFELILNNGDIADAKKKSPSKKVDSAALTKKSTKPASTTKPQTNSRISHKESKLETQGYVLIKKTPESEVINEEVKITYTKEGHWLSFRNLKTDEIIMKRKVKSLYQKDTNIMIEFLEEDLKKETSIDCFTLKKKKDLGDWLKLVQLDLASK